MSEQVTVTSPAKINLFLEIRGKHDAKYHEVVTLYQTIDLADEIQVSLTSQPFCLLRCNDSGVPFGKRNLCIKAFEAVRARADMKRMVEIHLKKYIPLGSGLGGGSSNAAAIIRALDHLFELGLSEETMMEIAGEVGTDVPFFVLGGAAVGRGRGNRLERVPTLPKPLWFVLIMPTVSVSTGTAYQWVGDYAGTRDLDTGELGKRMEAGDVEYLTERMFNAFEPIVFRMHPELEGWKRTLEEAGCVKAVMTGSGSALYGICESKKQAMEIASSLNDADGLTLATACHTTP